MTERPVPAGLREVRNFYIHLSELLCGLYPDLAALSAGYVDRTKLPQQLQQALNDALESCDESSGRQLREDFERVSRLVGEYEGLSESERPDWLQSQQDEKAYLTNRAINLMKQAASYA